MQNNAIPAKPQALQKPKISHTDAQKAQTQKKPRLNPPPKRQVTKPETNIGKSLAKPVKEAQNIDFAIPTNVQDPVYLINFFKILLMSQD